MANLIEKFQESWKWVGHTIQAHTIWEWVVEFSVSVGLGIFSGSLLIGGGVFLGLFLFNIRKKRNRVSLDLYKIDKDISEQRIETLYLAACGTSPEPIAFKLVATGVHPIVESGQGRFILEIGPRQRTTMSVDNGEPKTDIQAVSYNPRRKGLEAIRLELPYQTHADDIVRGDEFLITVKAFGGSSPVILEFYIGVGDNQLLWAQKVGSAKKITYLSSDG